MKIMSKIAKVFGVAAVALSTLIPSMALACPGRVGVVGPRPVAYVRPRFVAPAPYFYGHTRFERPFYRRVEGRRFVRY
jgi:hypothetical protein